MDKLRRRNAVLALVIFFLLVWIKSLYDDKNWILSENNQYFYSNLKKDDQIKKLTLKLDSLKKSNVILDKKETPKPKKKIINKDTTSTKDSILFVKYPPENELKNEIEKTDSLK